MTDKIFPFLWHHGEGNDAIREEIEKIYECGIRAFCVESRPHPDFCGEKWWRDFGFILEEARARDMRVWLLDDEHYPSGGACGALKKYPHLKQTNLVLTYMDVRGTLKGGKILLKRAGKDDETLLAAFAFPTDGKTIDFRGGQDLTELVHGDVLYWDVPKGHYRVYGIYKSKNAAEWDFVDVLNPESTALMISEIYQPHYDKFSSYFGNTFVGFFSDEPRFGNGAVARAGIPAIWQHRGLGRLGMAYPWSDAILNDLDVKDRRLLLSLWYDTDLPEYQKFRVRYMNYLTDAFAKNFSGMLGNWCKEHGVMYSGHIIEDAGAHVVTCCSAGHYFKSTVGQDIAGIDVVYNQIDTDFIDEPHPNSMNIAYGNDAFYNFTLPKLASSAAHLDERKQGRALCEIFGAFGWGESVAKMKKLVDFMFVRGINHFIPHAFNPFVEDVDSPPYFYCGGLNPQYESFVTLSKYMLTMTELLNGGKTDARVAVLYHAEGAWSGGRFLEMDGVCKWLTQHQIEFDIVPSYEILSVTEKEIRTKNCVYSYLVVPFSDYIEETLQEKLAKKAGAWSEVKTVDDLEKLDFSAHRAYTLQTPDKHIRVYRYLKEGKTYYLLSNEGTQSVKNVLTIEERGEYVCEDKQAELSWGGKTDGTLPFELLAGQSLLFTIGKSGAWRRALLVGEEKTEPLWTVEIANAPFTEWQFYDETRELYDLASWDRDPEFCGKIRYTGTFFVKAAGRALIDLGESTCGIRVKLNGQDLGERIATPYVYDTKEALKAGENKIEIVMTTTLGLKKRDGDSRYCAMGKYGLPQNPVLKFYKEEE
ncbi:MAG: hypothetical protein IJX81_02780 [Clostridia bacterium]|nr:hypothetical protein [Clostridia bacterium]